MVLGRHRAGHGRGFGVQAGGQVGGRCPLDVLLDVAQGDRRPGRQLVAEVERSVGEALVGEHPVDQSEVGGLRCGQAGRHPVELLGLGRTDQLGQEPAPAEVAGGPDAREGGDQDGPLGRHPQVGSQRDRQAGTGRRPWQCGDHRLGELTEGQRDLPLTVAEIGHPGLDRHRLVAARALVALVHPFHVAAGAEGAPGSGDHDHPDVGVGGDGRQGRGETPVDTAGQGVAPLRAIEGQHGHLADHLTEEVVGAGLERSALVRYVHDRSLSSWSLATCPDGGRGDAIDASGRIRTVRIPSSEGCRSTWCRPSPLSRGPPAPPRSTGPAARPVVRRATSSSSPGTDPSGSRAHHRHLRTGSFGSEPSTTTPSTTTSTSMSSPRPAGQGPPTSGSASSSRGSHTRIGDGT